MRLNLILVGVDQGHRIIISLLLFTNSNHALFFFALQFIQMRETKTDYRHWSWSLTSSRKKKNRKSERFGFIYQVDVRNHGREKGT